MEDLKQQSTRTKMNGSLSEEGIHLIHFLSEPYVAKFHMVGRKFYECEEDACGICDWYKTAYHSLNKDLANQYKPRWRLAATAEVDGEKTPLFISWYNLGKQFADCRNIEHDLSLFDLKIRTEMRLLGGVRFPAYHLEEVIDREDNIFEHETIQFPLANEAMTEDETVEFMKKLLA